MITFGKDHQIILQLKLSEADATTLPGVDIQVILTNFNHLDLVKLIGVESPVDVLAVPVPKILDTGYDVVKYEGDDHYRIGEDIRVEYTVEKVVEYSLVD